MNKTFSLLILATSFATASQASLQAPPSDRNLQLLQATGIVETYREVTKRQAGAMNPRMASAMDRISTADLAPAHACIVSEVYKPQNFSQQELSELIGFYESPLGKKVVLRTRQAVFQRLGDPALATTQVPPYTEAERQDMDAFRDSAAFRKYARMVQSEHTLSAIMDCILQAAGFEQPRR